MQFYARFFLTNPVLLLDIWMIMHYNGKILNKMRGMRNGT